MKNLNKKILIGISPNSKLLKEYKKSLVELNQIQFESAIGMMLGDSSLQSQNKGKTYRLKFEWGEKNKPYLDHVYNLFDEWILSKPHRKARLSPKGNLVVNWGFQTISHKAFNPLAKLFLINDKKGISDLLFFNNFTARSLAYWFMDDGGKLDYNKNSLNKSVVMNTQSFSEKEVEFLSSGLTKNYGLICETRFNKGKKVIVIKSESYSLFRQLIDPYIIPEMLYKLP